MLLHQRTVHADQKQCNRSKSIYIYMRVTTSQYEIRDKNQLKRFPPEHNLPVREKQFISLRANSPIWASEVSLARTREREAEERRACNDLS